MRNKIAGWFAVTFVVAMLVVLFPNKEVRDKIHEEVVNVRPEEVISLAERNARLAAVQEEANRLFSEGRYDEKVYVAHLVEIERASKYSKDDFGRWGNGGWATQAGMVQEDVWQLFRKGIAEGQADVEKLRLLTGEGSEILELQYFRPITSRWHWSELFRHLGKSYPITVIWAFFYHIVMLVLRRRRFITELLVPDRLIRASILWPCQMWYETREPRLAFKKASYAVVGAIAAALCFLPGSASGQSKVGGANKRTTNSLQLDLRNSWSFGDTPPDLNLLGRATFSRGKLVAENISTTLPTRGEWYTEQAVGMRVFQKPVLTLNAMAVVSRNSSGNAKVMAELQAFAPWRYGMLAVPVVRVEHDLESGHEKLALVAVPSARLSSRFVALLESVVSKSQGSTTFWSMGPGIQFKHWRSDVLELDLLHNSDGQTLVRAGMIANLAF